jgi:DNA topoisomerase-1
MHFDGDWSAEWQFAALLPKDGDKLWTDKAFAERVAKLKALRVLDVTEGQSRSTPPAPFITSTLQQAGSAALGFSPKKTMEVAQSLFAAGLITYMRTDNPNLSDEAIAAVRKLAAAKKLALPDSPRKWKAKGGAQGAHEGVRPTHFENEEAGSTADERKLYRLIWLRAVACQLADAVFDVRVAKLEAVDLLNGKTMEFEGRGRKLRFAGWKALTEKDSASEEEDQADNPVPQLEVGSVHQVERAEMQEKKTQPSPRYTEASLVKDLEGKEIGRPSTYASIIGNIHSRGYYTVEKKKIHGTALGERTFSVMEGQFSFLEYDYTKEMEEQLDAIAHGKQSYLNVVKRVYDDLNRELSNLKAPAGITVHACTECGKPLRRIPGGKGPFWGCSGYPDCKTTFEHDAKADAPILNGVKKVSAPKVAGPKCPDCGKPTYQRMAKTGPNAGKPFWRCSGYPECKGMVKAGEEAAGQGKSGGATTSASAADDKALLDML